MKVIHCKREKFDVYIGRPFIFGVVLLLREVCVDRILIV